MGGDLREFALIGEQSWCEEFGETEMGTLMELTLFISGLCVFPICGKYQLLRKNALFTYRNVV